VAADEALVINLFKTNPTAALLPDEDGFTPPMILRAKGFSSIASNLARAADDWSRGRERREEAREQAVKRAEATTRLATQPVMSEADAEKAGFSRTQLLQMQKVFSVMDRKGAGGLGLDECIAFAGEGAKELMKKLDTNDDGVITIEEWMEFVGRVQSKHVKKSAKKAAAAVGGTTKGRSSGRRRSHSTSSRTSTSTSSSSSSSSSSSAPVEPASLAPPLQEYVKKAKARFLQFEREDLEALAALEKGSTVVEGRATELRMQLDRAKGAVRKCDEHIAAQDAEIVTLQQQVAEKKFQKEADAKRKAQGGCSVQ
jgi:hypothetical protein